MPARNLFAALLASILFALPASAQEWSLDPVEDWADKEWNEVMKTPDNLVSNVPKAVWKALLDHQEAVVLGMAEEDFDKFSKVEKEKLRQMRDEKLTKRIKTILVDSGRFAKSEIPKMAKAFAAEIKNLPEVGLMAMVRASAKELLLDHLDRLKKTRIRLGHEKVDLTGPAPKRVYETKEGSFDPIDSISLPKVKVYGIKDQFVKTAFEKTWKHEYGKLKMTSLKFEGLYDGKAGSFKYKDEYGRQHSGVGVTFKAKSKFTAFRTDGQSKPLTVGNKDIYVRSSLSATILDLASEAEFNSTTLLTEHGLISHNKVKAGAGAKASARLPIEFELFVVKVRVTPYVEAYAGATAEAHANIELDWEGRIRFDAGAALSLGTGVGAGVIIEIQAGEFVKRMIAKLKKAIVETFRPIVDRLRGIEERGPALDGTTETVGLEELQDRYGHEGAWDPNGKSDRQIAMRYAPVIYHEIGPEPEADYLRRYNFDGDWEYNNNWENAVGKGHEKNAYVYYDIKETKSHLYVTYALFHPRRYTSNPIPGLKHLGRWENHTGGCVVVVKKGAAYGEEVEMIMTATGRSINEFSNRSDDERMDRNHGWWDGSVRFIDEPNHPFFDFERVHPQVWVDAKDHGVYGFNGRQDDGGFDEKGVIYFPTGTAEAPGSPHDSMVGYDLLPLQILASQADKITRRDSWDADNRPAAHLKGKDGLNHNGYAPWGWKDQGEDRDREEADQDTGHSWRDAHDTSEWVMMGDLFFDPAKVVRVNFEVPEDFGRGYIRHDYITPDGNVDLRRFEGGPNPTPKGEKGLVGALEGN